MAKAIMIQGTASNVGKSVLVAALCRIFKQDGFRVAPFKAQNMALNSYITPQGFEIGRAQAMQAEACGIVPDIRMNPILLKPNSETGCQVIVNGKAIGNQSAQKYWSEKAKLRPKVLEAYHSLAKEYDIIVIEGAGSPAEINLKQDDLVNMGLAKAIHAPVLLVGDIDRGGVFASLYGTIQLLDPCEQDLICGTVINKFRGDLKILEPGLQQLESLIKKPVLGVVPYQKLDLDDEDSLSDRLQTNFKKALIQIAIVRLPHLSNFTDFNELERFSNVGVHYISRPEQLENVDLIILPGTKNTIEDLKWLRTTGLEAKIQRLHENKTPVFGICGGYQMMGQMISDPQGVESGGAIKGIGLLPTTTIFQQEKVTTQAKGQIGQIQGFFSKLSGKKTEGYEIHMGITHLQENACPFQTLSRKEEVVSDGCYTPYAYGTYLHGFFDQTEIAQTMVQTLFERKNLPFERVQSMESQKEREYEKLAALVRNALDLPKIYQIIEKGL